MDQWIMTLPCNTTNTSCHAVHKHDDKCFDREDACSMTKAAALRVKHLGKPQSGTTGTSDELSCQLKEKASKSLSL